MRIIYISLGFLLLFYVVFDLLKDDIKQKPTKKLVEKSLIHKNIKDETSAKQETINSTQTTTNKQQNIPNYKDIFVEASKNTLQDFQNEQQLKEIDKDVDKIILDADAFIKKNNLILPKYEPTEDEQKKVKELQNTIDNLKIKIEELPNAK